ncbi:DUF1289 domain-containing protein [uncultured Rhodospira sp.]|uniref:DUF1289 domain-containing protein n=1 Tax=uncultured Rhodospira sp. TaxID=1936189 RepID=UPI002629A882|nr:DUF1289 domain-containing protein [uncultured Rhodospira sp.]
MAESPDEDDEVPSPCISVCRLDEAGAVCVGCGRTLAEIRDWKRMTSPQRRAVWARLRREGHAPDGQA